MPTGIIRQSTPEEEELLRKREELTLVRSALAERELELADLRAQLRSFEGRYLRQVGGLYAELDEWDARIAELEASRSPSEPARQRAEEARKRAEDTRETTHGEASKAQDFQPSANLKSLFRDVAKRIHPDFARDDADQQHRTRLMAQANEAYSRGDAEILKRILDEFRDSPESVQGEGVGAELVRTIRQIHQAKKKISAIEQELTSLRASEIAQLKSDAEVAQQQGRDLLMELATNLQAQIADAKKKLMTIEAEANGR